MSISLPVVHNTTTLKRSRASLSLWVVCLLCYSSYSLGSDSWSLLGVAHYEQLNRTLLIARLNVKDTSVTADTLLAGKDAFRLEVAIATRSVSARRWRNMWMEGVMINHQLDQLSTYTHDINSLMASLSQRLKMADRFQLEYHPETGSQVILNDVALGPFKETQFAVLLLRGWIGNVPLSSGFKKSLLSDKSEEWNQQMNALALSTARRQETVKLLAGKSTKATDQTIKSAAVEKASLAANAKPTLTTPTLAKPEIQVIAPAVVEPKDRVATPMVETATDQVSSQDQSSSGKQPTDLGDNTQTEFVADTSAPEAIEQAASDDAEVGLDNLQESPSADEVANVLDEDLLRLRQEYYQTLVAKVEAKKAIPFKAFQRRWKGNVRIQVTIDRLGRVLESVLLETSRHKLFNDQALTAVKNAEPLPEIPAEIEGNEFTFSVPLSYTFID